VAAAVKSNASGDASGHVEAVEEDGLNSSSDHEEGAGNALESDDPEEPKTRTFGEGERDVQGGHGHEETGLTPSHKNRRLREEKAEKKKSFSLLSHQDEDLNADITVRPRKRQKLGIASRGGDTGSSLSPSQCDEETAASAAADSSGSSDSSSEVPSSPVQSYTADLPREQSTATPTPPPALLPVFPPPSRPDPPEKSELASQGIDRALARAQLVDPSLSTPLSFDKEGHEGANAGLSARTLKRLRDLGITELFAGTYHALNKLRIF
jgi:hypothetical protein